MGVEIEELALIIGIAECCCGIAGVDVVELLVDSLAYPADVAVTVTVIVVAAELPA